MFWTENNDILLRRWRVQPFNAAKPEFPLLKVAAALRAQTPAIVFKAKTGNRWEVLNL
jgi:hypothetical protein